MNYDNLKVLLKEDPGYSCWLKDAEYRRENRGWLRMSSNIALKILCHLRQNGIKKKELAERIKVTPSYVTNLLKGQENLTLETIYKIEEALKIKLITI